ncbi:SDR family oxidoreductase [Bradyrhizobium sp. UFLA01-814]|uniref:SDR family oxidoreductase n=1 Tax=Bradyrhizobium sp. UFLA01-814 TaxID=3023480 RepID=UPI00398A83C0
MTIVLITGTNRGVGLALARQYVDSGAKVIACCREPARADALTEIAAASNGRARVLPIDMANEASIRTIKSTLGDEPIDILLLNAGINGHPKPQTAYEIDGENYIQCMRVNALGPMLLSQVMLANLKAGREKKLVVITSAYGSVSREWTKAVNAHERYAYRASKAALNSGMRALSRDWAEHGIVVGLMDPGWVRTDMALKAGENPAMISTEESAIGIIKRIGQLTPENSGAFTRFNGEALPW